MTFFNRKEEVIDIELTQYGKLLLAKGKFKPKKYAFFDDDVIYDSQYMTPTDPTSVASPVAENQNDASTRIKEAVRGHAQHNYGSAYNLGEIEEAGESVLMSTAVKNFKGIEQKVVTEGIIEKLAFTKTFKYSQFASVMTLSEWVDKVVLLVNKGAFGFKTTTLGGTESQVKIDYNFEPPSGETKKLSYKPTLNEEITVTKYYPIPNAFKKSYPVYETNLSP
jgi:hypothetical protein